MGFSRRRCLFAFAALMPAVFVKNARPAGVRWPSDLPDTIHVWSMWGTTIVPLDNEESPSPRIEPPTGQNDVSHPFQTGSQMQRRPLRVD